MRKKEYRIAQNLSDNVPGDSLRAVYSSLTSFSELHKDYFNAFTPAQFLMIVVYIYSIKIGESKSWADSQIANAYIISTFIFNEDVYEEEVCEDCDGNGSIKCDTCYGSGEKTCDECEGEGSKDCDYCGGSGEDEGGSCYECDGAGLITCEDCQGTGEVKCDTCGGDGEESCNNCDGSGVINSSRNLIDFFVYFSLNKKINKEVQNSFELNNKLDEDWFGVDDAILLYSTQDGEEMTDDREILEDGETYCNFIEPLMTSPLDYQSLHSFNIRLKKLQIPDIFLA